MTAARGNGGWNRLDARTLAVDSVRVVGPLVPVAAAAVLLGRVLQGRETVPAAIVVALVLGTFVHRVLRFATSRYRVGDDVVELRRGLLYTTRLAVPRDRVRSVDLTATGLLRLFGLTVVTVGTGRTAAGSERAPLRLECVSRGSGERLRRELLAHARAQVPEPTGELARLDPRWARYAPLSVTGAAAVWVLCGVAVRFLDALGVDVLDGPAARAALADLPSLGPVRAGTAAVACVLVLGGLGSVVLFAEAWWGSRLTREPDRSLRAVRGLLTRRSVSLERRRLCGVELREPLTLRWAGAAGLRAVATGLSRGAGATTVGPSTLLPPAPGPTAARVAGQVLGAGAPTVGAVALRAHPAAALRRRVLRAAAAGAVATGAVPLATSGAPGWWVAAGAVTVAAVLLAVDAYRGLGHARVGRFLLVRSGTLVRRTVVLDREALIGWRVCRSPAQRAAGLCTLVATSAAGAGHFPVHDVDETGGIAFARDTTPGLLEPFLVGAGAPAGGGQIQPSSQAIRAASCRLRVSSVPIADDR